MFVIDPSDLMRTLAVSGLDSFGLEIYLKILQIERLFLPTVATGLLGLAWAFRGVVVELDRDLGRSGKLRSATPGSLLLGLGLVFFFAFVDPFTTSLADNLRDRLLDLGGLIGVADLLLWVLWAGITAVVVAGFFLVAHLVDLKPGRVDAHREKEEWSGEAESGPSPGGLGYRPFLVAGAVAALVVAGKFVLALARTALGTGGLGFPALPGIAGTFSPASFLLFLFWIYYVVGAVLWGRGSLLRVLVARQASVGG
ncbi:MAG TPA: hypothetical protein VFE20_03375 [Thermoleophilia bacterium]|nr:hypothetical protein [Thermoleophilia bacterium]